MVEKHRLDLEHYKENYLKIYRIDKIIFIEVFTKEDELVRLISFEDEQEYITFIARMFQAQEKIVEATQELQKFLAWNEDFGKSSY